MSDVVGWSKVHCSDGDVLRDPNEHGGLGVTSKRRPWKGWKRQDSVREAGGNAS